MNVDQQFNTKKSKDLQQIIQGLHMKMVVLGILAVLTMLMLK